MASVFLCAMGNERDLLPLDSQQSSGCNDILNPVRGFTHKYTGRRMKRKKVPLPLFLLPKKLRKRYPRLSYKKAEEGFDSGATFSFRIYFFLRMATGD